jgi:hypothetical protein
MEVFTNATADDSNFEDTFEGIFDGENATEAEIAERQRILAQVRFYIRVLPGTAGSNAVLFNVPGYRSDSILLPRLHAID